MKRRIILVFVVLIFTMGIVNAENDEKIYITKQVKPESLKIDGQLNDIAWDMLEWRSDFIQREPFDGKLPSQKTAFKILYDEDNIYIAIMAYDSEPDSIVKRIAHKDNIDGDQVAVQFDSYNDNLTAFSFMVSASGVKTDFIISNDGEHEDFDWNPIWYVKTSSNNEGWIAEMQIPLSQLRFNGNKEQLWGLNVGRFLFRKEELVFWSPIPQDAPGWVSEFGQLHGIDNIKPKKEISIIPYTVGKIERFEKEEGNPFQTGKSSQLSAGFDAKIGVTNDLTVDLSVNPDFGQVEADPSEVNLTAYETYFSEKRPFFIEGRNIMNYQLMSGGGDLSSENLFYSRRIGRTPHYYPDIDSDEYINMPDNSSILGAIKLTGKTKNGWSIGVLESITTKEEAEIDNSGDRRFETVEPFTNYFLGRLQKDINEGNTSFGTMITATNRSINSDDLLFLHKEAYTGGIDFQHQWKDKTYFFNFKGIFSYVKGDPEAILNTQTSSARYYQRPDASYLSVDSSRTSLSGTGGSIQIGKSGNGHFKYAAFLNWKSPGLELNDMGYLRNADNIMQIFWVQYRIWEPFSIFRSINVNLNQWSGWNFGGQNVFNGANVNLNLQFKNYWSFGMGLNPDFESTSSSTLRGGPSFKEPGSFGLWYNLNSDGRKKLSMHIGSFLNWGFENQVERKNFWMGFDYKPYDAFSLSLSPSISHRKTDLQYVTTESYIDDDRYILASINQKTLSMSIRLNLNLTPDLSIQYYGQPFIAAGKYSNFKRVTNSIADNYNDRFHEFIDDEISYDFDNEIYNIDENSNGISDYNIENPDFNILQFRSNLVARWEYLPGSTLYLVWSQGKNDYYSNGNFALSDVNNLIDIYSHNIFLVKLSYRLGV
ncbi:MAG: DUF5916 domain-containing protein [Bacteroidales bacterium]|jgi:hypothetical protein|nr:DUF5916 domain-containing protein [Bacteroidales bacterium]